MKKTMLLSVLLALSVRIAFAADTARLPVIFLLGEEEPAAETTHYVDVHPLLEADCSSGCHSGEVGGYLVNDNLDDSYASAITKINPGIPESSLLLSKPALLTNHGGGKIPLYGENEIKYSLVLKWIVDGALRR